jgi:hypothetical protein
MTRRVRRPPSDSIGLFAVMCLKADTEVAADVVPTDGNMRGPCCSLGGGGCAAPRSADWSWSGRTERGDPQRCYGTCGSQRWSHRRGFRGRGKGLPAPADLGHLDRGVDVVRVRMLSVQTLTDCASNAPRLVQTIGVLDCRVPSVLGWAH